MLKTVAFVRLLCAVGLMWGTCQAQVPVLSGVIGAVGGTAGAILGITAGTLTGLVEGLGSIVKDPAKIPQIMDEMATGKYGPKEFMSLLTTLKDAGCLTAEQFASMATDFNGAKNQGDCNKAFAKNTQTIQSALLMFAKK